MLNFNVAPYFDDFDEKNKFYRILYRPSYAVQGRELTQAQSITQEQIKKFGDHIFEEGAMVIPGQITFDQDVSYQKMDATYGNPPDDVPVDPENFLGFTIIGESSGLEATIVNVATKDETDPLTFMIKVKNSGDSNEEIGFWDGETIYRKDNGQIRATVQGTLDEVNPTYESAGKGAITSIDKGVYYFGGIFIDNEAQSIIVSKYGQRPTCKVGLRIYESIITPEEDLSLTDNAQGSPNYAAPGAHRYKIDLKLEYVDEDANVSDDFIILQYLENGVVVKEIRTSAYSELEKTFARRTFDESGSYTVRPFSIKLKEHYRDEADDQYKEGAYFPPYGDKDKMVAEMGTGKAYILGYEMDRISPTLVEMDKARDVAIGNNTITNFDLGNYITIQSINNIPRIDAFGIVEIYNSNVSTPGTPNGSKIGECRVRAIRNISPTESYLGIFDINIDSGYNFEADAKMLYDTNGVGENNFTCNIKLIDNRAYIEKPSKNVLVFKTPHTNIKSFLVGGSGIDTNYNSVRAYHDIGTVANTATIVAKDDEVFQQNVGDYIIADRFSGNIITNAVFNFTGAPTGKVIEIGNLNVSDVNVIAPVTKMISTQKTKYLQDDGSLNIAIPNKKQGSRDYLGKADGIRVKAVYDSGNETEVATVDSYDITSRYQFDTGQRDNMYDVCSIVLKGGQLPPEGQILVTFDYFTHTEGDYFSVDSYVDVDFDEIPVYDSNENGKTYVLADAFDFRPRMSDNRIDGFTGSGASIGELPQMFNDVHSDYEYYLNRIDYLYADFRGDFIVSKGIPAINPKPPEKPETGMILYELYVNAYTFKPSDVEPSYRDNKRYTMKDIGDLDRRIGNLEYYTALSLLERETASMEILDDAGLNRFKNGFIVDPFDSHKVGDATHTDYNCSVDPHEKIMRPKFNDENIGMLYDAVNSNHVQRTGGIVTLPYTHVGINKQTQASKYENINPFAFRNIFGAITFNPDSDVWHDKEKLPTLVVNHSPNYEALKFIADNTKDLNGVEWGRWNDVGGRKNVKSKTRGGSSSTVFSRRDTGISHDEGWLQRRSSGWSATTTTWEQDQSRAGVKTTHKDSNVISESLGDRITEVNYIPYMRSIPVLVKTDQMKKKTKLYPFFDSISMSSHCEPPSINEYCTPASILHFSSISGEFQTANQNEEVIVGTQSGATAVVAFQTENYLQVVNVQGTFKLNETVVGDTSMASCAFVKLDANGLGDPIVTGEFGEIAVIWKIPNDNILTFMTGEREFRLTDQMTNADPVHTMAKGMFKSHGMSSKSEDTVLSTKTIKFDKTPVKQNRSVQRKSSSSSSWSNNSGWFDPIAQSFLIQESGGCFITKVRLWFQNKDEEEAVVCEIRNMVNGYPAEIPMATITVYPRSIPISERAPGDYADFIFPEPLYVQEGEDYCFVLKPAVASASYTVWVAETGRKDLETDEIITGKQSLGSFFKSQNASTWTPNQNEDIMFELFKAKFDINSDGTAMMVNDEIGPENLGLNPIETYKGENKVRIYQKNHGLTVGSKYKISGFDNTDEGYNGFLPAHLNRIHNVVDLEIDSFVIEIPSEYATKTGLTGGSEIMGSRNFQIDMVHPIINELLIDGTGIDWSLQNITGTSINGAQSPYLRRDYVPCINNEDIFMDEPMILASRENQEGFLDNDKSMKMIGLMYSENENVSPIIDAAPWNPLTNKGDDIYFKQSTSTAIMISNRIDSPDTETLVIGTDSIFNIGSGEDEMNIYHPSHELGTGAYIYIEDFTDDVNIIDGEFDPNGLHEITVVDMDNYLVQMKATSSGYSDSGGGSTTLTHSKTHFKYVPETQSFDCSTSARYMTKQVTLTDPAENIKIYFGAVREQEADIDVFFKTRSPYEVTEWNEIDWIRIDSPDENVGISQNREDFKDYEFTLDLNDPNSLIAEPFNAISVKLVMKSTNSTQVPVFTDFRLVCTT